MKKIVGIIFFSVLLIAMHSKLYAQAPATTLTPATFTAEDQVTITADVTGTGMDGISPAYIWIWCYHNPTDQANDANATTALNDGTSWNPLATPELVKMTNVSGNVWTYTFTGTSLFGLTPGTMYSFNYLVRNLDGSKQTNNALAKGSAFKFDPLVFTPTEARVFPQKVDTSDVVSLNFDQSLASSLNDQRMSPDSVTVIFGDSTIVSNVLTPNQIGNSITLPLTNNLVGSTIWTGTFIPANYFPSTADRTKIATFQYFFSGTVLDTTGAPMRVSTSTNGPVSFTRMQ